MRFGSVVPEQSDESHRCGDSHSKAKSDGPVSEVESSLLRFRTRFGARWLDVLAIRRLLGVSARPCRDQGDHKHELQARHPMVVGHSVAQRKWHAAARSIRQYLEGQAGDERVVHLEKVAFVPMRRALWYR